MLRSTHLWTKPRRWYLDSRPALVAWWVVGVLGLEVLGRRSATDLGDAAGAMLWVALVTITVQQHRQTPIRFLTRAMAAAMTIRERFRASMPTWGVDFREAPPLPRGFPAVASRLLLTAGALAAVSLGFRGYLLGGLRDGLRQISGAVAVTFVTVLWAILAGLAIFLVAFTFAQLHDYLLNRTDVSNVRRPRIESLAALTSVLALVVATITLPPWLPFVLIAFVSVTALALLQMRSESPMLMWRVPKRPSQVMSWAESEMWLGAIAPCVLIAITVVACGDQLVASGNVHRTPISGFLGISTAWAGLMAYATWSWIGPIRAFRSYRRDPARPVPTQVQVEGAVSSAAHGPLQQAGFVPVDRPTRDAVRIRLDEAAPSVGTPTFDRSVRWPLAVRPSDAESGELHRRIRRRDDVQRRRRFVRGLERTFRLARKRRFKRGTGFWVAPQYWYVVGLGRDTQEENSWSVGPPYRETIPHAARAHVATVLEALDVDLIFVEDRVPFRHLKRVFWVFFDIYDILGRSPIEERHFTGVPGLKVVIHEFTTGNPYRESGYPETDYEEVGRARILHVFRDRGDAPEIADDPATSDLVPEPAVG